MTEPYIGEIRIVSFPFAPRGWAFCDGQRLPVNQNQALYSLLGTRYGGDGVTVFALPDLRGRMPVHTDSGRSGQFPVGAAGGEETHTLTSGELPAHGHQVVASNAPGTAAVPTGAYPAATQVAAYAAAANTPMNASAVSRTGGGQPHENMPPYLALNFAIALQGIFPSRS
jgi:microcystin-dependent protein